MIKLNVGNKWDTEFLATVIELNKKYEKNDIRVAELYGNTCNQTLAGVRPQARLPFGLPVSVEKYIKKANDNNIEINYTFNIACVGNLIQRDRVHSDIQTEIQTMENLGVKRFTIFSPYILTHFHFNSKLEISTIHNNTNINNIIGTATLSENIDKLCLPIYSNRNFQRLKKIVPILNRMGVKPELILNEFCTSYNNVCILRTECYNLQSHELNMYYPFDMCSSARDKNPVQWFKAPFILPQWMDYYKNEYGIENFKLTGRTLPTPNVLRVLEYYMDKYCDIPLEQLWGAALPHSELLNKDLVMTGDINISFLYEFENRDCESLHCGYECRRCDIIWNDLKK